MVFPEGILFDYENDCYRTQRINSLFGIIPSLSNNFDKNKNGITPKNKELSRLVLKAGLEPARPNGHWILSPTCLPIPPLQLGIFFFSERKTGFEPATSTLARWRSTN